MPTQKSVIRWDGELEELILQTKYEGPAEELVWLVPVPSEPKVTKASPRIFEKYSKRTQKADIAYTSFIGYWTGGFGSESESPLKWQERIGAYDVALLSPVGSTQVIQWLEANDYGIQEQAIPILEDYVKREWWMIASRIHKDALDESTREELAKGTLHPLNIQFKTETCVFPMRLTSLVAGPVEELIYIEAEDHYMPKTLVDAVWDINYYGGPIRTYPAARNSDWAKIQLIIDGKEEFRSTTCISKLRCTFQPDEMIDDIYFTKADYASLATKNTPDKIAQVATQYGRHCDPAGIPLLLNVLASTELTNEPYIRSCIWALGEIAIENNITHIIEDTLVHCTKQNNIEVKMEAYKALALCKSNIIGPLFIEEFNYLKETPVEQWNTKNKTLFWLYFSDFASEWLDKPG